MLDTSGRRKPGTCSTGMQDLPAELDGAEAVAAAQMALVGIASRTCLYVDHLQ